jgi:aldose sugar dehydrogenase
MSKSPSLLIIYCEKIVTLLYLQPCGQRIIVIAFLMFKYLKKWNKEIIITMQCIKVRVSSLSFFALIFLVLIIVLSIYGNDALSSSPISKVAQAAVAISVSPSSDSHPDFNTAATIAKIQFPGIIPSNNNNNNPSSDSATPNLASNSTPSPPIVHRNTRARPALEGPTLNDPNLKVEQIIHRGFDFSTSMAFLGPNDLLVLEKNTGIVHRIVNGKVLPEPLLDVNVANQAERGLLGIAITNDGNINSNTKNGDGNTRHVFLYYTESGGGKDGDDTPNTTTTGATAATTAGSIPPAGNRLYRYDLDLNSNKLTNPLLLLDLPASPPPERANTEKNHNGGKLLIGPDNNVYLGIGDVGGHKGQSENIANGSVPDGTGGILRITQDGQIANNPPLGSDTIPLAIYYAYGIRNTFGMDFDPLTDNLWDTENGNTFGDEINLVNPGFNSGWSQVAGIWETGSKPGPAIGADSNNPPKGLVGFGGKGVYRAPEFAWLQTIAPTALKFLNSDKLGQQYENTIFMGDVDYGRLYNFKLNEDRTGLLLGGPLADKIANTPNEMTQQGGVIIGQGFGVITDMQIGPDDGYLYILTLRGSLYRIVPSSSS